MRKLTLAAILMSLALTHSPRPVHADDLMAGIGEQQGDERIVHALNRMGYGPRPGDIDRLREEGLYRWIVLQLHPERVPDQDCENRLRGLELFRLTAAELEQKFPAPTKEERERLAKLLKELEQKKKSDASKAEIRMLEMEVRELRRRNNRSLPLQELSRAKMIRAIHSNRQLEQVMADFWFNHFNVFGRKGPASLLIPEFEEHVLRPNLFGKFEDLLVAVAKSPAMLFYLDNWMSAAPEGAPVRKRGKRSARRRGGKRGLNENYARELLELHTLGVDNGYTQQDIIETARCFTGWTISGGGYRGRTFEFIPEMHDAGPKSVMGKRIRPGRGIEDGREVIHFLATHPNTARFICEKLCRRFVSDQPPEALVERCTGTFLESDGDIRLVLYRIFTSPEFFSREALRMKVKRPHEYVASSIRAMGLTTPVPMGLLYQVGQMGEPLYLCEPPTGYSDLTEKWSGTNAVLARVNFATALAFGRMAGMKPDYAAIGRSIPATDLEVVTEWLCRRYIGLPLSPDSEAALKRAVEKTRARYRQGGRRASAKDALSLFTALILGSPDFQMQ